MLVSARSAWYVVFAWTIGRLDLADRVTGMPRETERLTSWTPDLSPKTTTSSSVLRCSGYWWCDDPPGRRLC